MSFESLLKKVDNGDKADKDTGASTKNAPSVGGVGFSSLLSKVDQGAVSSSQAKANVNASSYMTPEQEAEAYNLSKESGLPISTVRLQPQLVKEKSLYKSTRVNSINDYLAADIGNATISKDDVPNLERAERVLSGKKAPLGPRMGELKELPEKAPERVSTLERLKTASYIGQSNVELGHLRFQQLGGDASQETEDRIRDIKEGIRVKSGLPPLEEPEGVLDTIGSFIEKGFISTAEQLPIITGATVKGLERGLQGAVAGAGAGALTGQPELIPALSKAGFQLGFRVGTTEEIFKQEAGLASDELLDFRDETGKPLDPDIVWVASMGIGGFNAGLELAELSLLLKTIPGASKLLGRATTAQTGEILKNPTVRQQLKDIAKKYAGAAGFEPLQEMAQEAITIIGGELAKLADEGKFEPIKLPEAAKRVGAAGIQSIGPALIFPLPGTLMGVYHTQSNIDTSNNFKDKTEAERAAISETLTHQRSPDHAKRFIETVGADQDVYISAEGIRLMQSLPPEQRDNILNKIGVAPDKAQQAVVTGVDTTIKSKELLTLADDEYNIIKEDVKPAPGAYTQREITEGAANEDIENLVNLVKEDVEKSNQINAEINRIQEEGKKAGLTEELSTNAPLLIQGIANKLELENVDSVEFLKKISLKKERFADIKALIEKGKQIFQADIKEPKRVVAPRGMLTIEEEAYTISLFEDADLSTVLHEVGHIALNEYTNLETLGQASESLINDMGVIREWVGAEKGQDFTTPQLEQFARGFEAYLLEGKAPTSSLREAFARFQRWLAETYKVLKAINSKTIEEALKVKLNPQVRRVFDRMLSTNLEVEAAAAENGFIVKTKEEMDALGMTKPDQVFATRLMEIVDQKAKRRLTRDRDKGTKENRKTWADEARTEIKEEFPIFKVADSIKDATLFLKATRSKEKAQLNRQEFIERYGEEAIKDMPVSGLLIKDGIALDEAAITYGYDDSNSMMEAFFDAPKFTVAVNQRVAEKQAAHDAQFRAEDYFVDLKEYRDYLNIMARYIGGRTIDEAAINEGIERNTPRWEKEARAEIIQESPELTGTELDNAVNARVQQKVGIYRQQKARPSTVSIDTIKDLARRTMAATTVRDARRVDKYMSAMKKASSDERRAILRRDWGEASRQSELARFNYEMAGLSVKVREEVDTIQKRAKRIGKPKKKELIDVTHKEAILHLINRYNIASLVPTDALVTPDYATLFAGDKYGNDGFSDTAFLESNVRDFRDLSTEQLRDLDNAIRYLEGQGRTDNKTHLSDGVTRLDTVGRDSMAEMDAQKRQKVYDQMNPWRRLNDPARKKFSEFTNISFLTTAYGGYKSLTGGQSVIEKYISENLKDMTDDLTNRMRELEKRVKPHRDHIVDAQRKLIKKNKGRKLFVTDNGVPVPDLLQKNGAQLNYWTPEQIFAMAFNRGNDSNTNALIAGFEGLTLGQVDSLLNQYLTIEDIDAVQGIINEMERLFPEANQVHVRMKNYGMVKIEPRPWVFKGKTFKGGYYPLSIDRRLASVNTDVFNNLKEAEEWLEGSEAKYTVPFAASNFGITRKDGHALPLSLSLWPIQKHFDKVNRYIAMAEGVRDIYRIVTYSERVDGGTKSFKKSAVRLLGEDMYEQVLPAIQHVVNPRLSGVDIPGSKFVGWLRAVAVSRNIAAKLFTGIKQPFSVFGGVHDLGVKTGGGVKLGIELFIKGSTTVLASPSAAWNSMLKKSPFMFARVTSWERDLLRPHFNKMSPAEREFAFGDSHFTWEDVVRATFITVSAPDIATVTPIWWGAYLGKLEQGATEEQSVRHADNIVRHSQPTAAPIDRSAWFRKNGFWGLFNLHQGYTTGVYGQRQRTHYRAWRQGRITTTQYAKFNTMDAIIPMTLMQIMISWLRGGDLTDEDEWTEIGFKSLLNAAFLGVPMAVSAIEALVAGGRGDLLEIPGAGQVDRWLQTGKLLVGGIDGMTRKEKERAYWGVFDMVSDISRVPMSRVVRQAVKGRDVKEKLFGPRKKKK